MKKAIVIKKHVSGFATKGYWARVSYIRRNSVESANWKWQYNLDQCINKLFIKLWRDNASVFLLLAVQNFKDHSTHVVIGPFDEAVSLATEALNISYLATTTVTSKNTSSTFQLVPNLDDFSHAMLDLIKKYKWQDVSIFFDDSKGRYCQYEELNY